MDVEELSMIGPIVDLSSVDSIHRKRITAFVNHFIIQTASFLNTFAKMTENKLFEVDNRLQKLEASLILLENKLNSISGLDVVEKVKEETLPAENVQEIVSKEVADVPKDEQPQEVVEVETPKLDESLQKFVKMLHVGVPVPAVKLKMQQENISLENQNLVLNQ